jgi:hypothetical protein
LLAIAECQATPILNLLTPSLASQLLQGLWVYAEIVNEPNTVGAGLLAMAECQATPILNLLTPSLASQLLQDLWVYAEIVNEPNTVGAGLLAMQAPRFLRLTPSHIVAVQSFSPQLTRAGLNE